MSPLHRVRCALAIALALSVLMPSRAATLRGAAQAARHSLAQHTAMGTATALDPAALNVADDAQLNVWAVEAPLSKAKYGNLLGKLNLFHSGIVVEDPAAGTNTTFEYTAIHFGSFFPKVVGSGSDAVFDWQDAAIVVPPHPTNMQYWTRYHFFGRITGAGFSAFVSEFLPSFNATNPDYNLFQLVPTDGGAGSLPSSTCYDFQFAALRFLHAQPGTLFSRNTMARDEVWLMAAAGSVTAANIDDPATHARAATFYSTVDSIPHLVTSNITKVFTKDLVEIAEKLGGDAFFKDPTQYYEYHPAKPYLQVLYREELLWN